MPQDKRPPIELVTVKLQCKIPMTRDNFANQTLSSGENYI